MELRKNNLLDRTIRGTVILYLVFAFVLTVRRGIKIYTSHDAWVVGDWLINYHGGFVRRGLLGESFIFFANFFKTNPGVFFLAFTLICYAIFFLFSGLSLLKQDILWPYLWLIFSPFVYLFQINDSRGGFRKEIIYIALLAFVVWAALQFSTLNFQRIFFASLLIYPFLILAHEMLAIFLPYLALVGVIYIPQKWTKTLLAIFPSAIAFGASILTHPTRQQQKMIYEALKLYPMERKGSILWLTKSLRDALSHTKHMLLYKHYLTTYFLVGLLALLAFIPILNRFAIFLKNKKALFLFGTSIAGTFPLLVIAVDWGRFIYIHLVSWFLISLLVTDTNFTSRIANFLRNKIWLQLLLALLSIVYFTMWHIPHCCGFNPWNTFLTHYFLRSETIHTLWLI